MEIVIFALLCTLTVQQTVLFSSSESNTVLTIPSGQTIVSSTFHETAFPNFIGLGAHWVFKPGVNSWPVGDSATFKAQFYADCTAQGTLVIVGDNIFTASLNGGAPFTGDEFPKVSYLPLNLVCGLNTLVITVTSLHFESPSGLIFAVTQNQSKCY